MILFKEEQYEKEWNDSHLDSRLKFIGYGIASYMWEKFGLNMTITGIFRTQEKQNEIYKDNPEYKIKPWDSVHQYWRGFDIRSSEMTDKQIVQLVNYVNDICDYGKVGVFTAKYHDVGVGFHFHLQTNSGNETILRKL